MGKAQQCTCQPQVSDSVNMCCGHLRKEDATGNQDEAVGAWKPECVLGSVRDNS